MRGHTSTSGVALQNALCKSCAHERGPLSEVGFPTPICARLEQAERRNLAAQNLGMALDCHDHHACSDQNHTELTKHSN